MVAGVGIEPTTRGFSMPYWLNYPLFPMVFNSHFSGVTEVVTEDA